MKLIYQSSIANFIYFFREGCKKRNENATEISDNDIENILVTFFKKPTLTEAKDYLYNIFDKYVKGLYGDVNWELDRPELEKTEEYIAWTRHSKIENAWWEAMNLSCVETVWVKVNGKANTDEEAAKKAADKWCRLIFNWHLQDNGALNEEHPGGFTACALGTILADKCRKDITEDMKVKAHELFVEYYLHMLHGTFKDEDWLRETFKDTTDRKEEDKFNWEWGFHDLSCDYGPSYPLLLILLAAGIPENVADSICPWKTSIKIRKEDNAVLYCTYGKTEEL